MLVVLIFDSMVFVISFNYGGVSKVLSQVGDNYLVVVFKNNQFSVVIIMFVDYCWFIQVEENFVLYCKVVECLCNDDSILLIDVDVFGEDYELIDDGFELEFE